MGSSASLNMTLASPSRGTFRPLDSDAQLTSLDMVIVSEESEAFANTVFLKKSMYYNMRSRIVKRHAGHVVRKVTIAKSHKGSTISGKCRILQSF